MVPEAEPFRPGKSAAQAPIKKGIDSPIKEEQVDRLLEYLQARVAARRAQH